MLILLAPFHIIRYEFSGFLRKSGVQVRAGNTHSVEHGKEAVLRLPEQAERGIPVKN